MENNEKKESVTIQLERHKWPDEIKKERHKRLLIVSIVGTIILSFGIGWFARGTRAISSILPVEQDSEIARFEEVYGVLKEYWYFGNEMDDIDAQLIDNAINGMLVLNGDLYTSYLTAKQASDLTVSINGEFVGIGIQYSTYNGLNVITKVFRESPAENAGLKAGDILYSVEGVILTEENTEEVLETITGESGTQVTVTVQRGKDLIEKEITRGTVNALAHAEVIDNNVGYLQLSTFGSNLGSLSEQYLSDFESKGVEKLIIDLRGNGGGYLTAIEQMASLLIPKGSIVYGEEFKDGSVTEYKTTEENQFSFDKIVILIDGNSASASEVLTLALKENDLNVEIVGVNSFGKGTVQTSRRISSDGSELKVTIAKWLDPEGNNIHGVGIKPDVEQRLDDVFYATYPTFAEGETFAFDSVGTQTAFVQLALRYLGYNVNRTDGYFDQSTLDAFKAFQTQAGLSADGIITKENTKVLYSTIIANYNENASTKDLQLLKALEVINE